MHGFTGILGSCLNPALDMARHLGWFLRVQSVGIEVNYLTEETEVKGQTAVEVEMVI